MHQHVNFAFQVSDHTWRSWSAGGGWRPWCLWCPDCEPVHQGVNSVIRNEEGSPTAQRMHSTPDQLYVHCTSYSSASEEVQPGGGRPTQAPPLPDPSTLSCALCASIAWCDATPLRRMTEQ